MNELIVLDLSPAWGNETNIIHPVILRDDQRLVLVDCGYIDSLPLLEAAFTAHSLSLSDLTHVIITHHDHDHVGTLAALKRRNPQMKVVTSRAEEAYLSGKLPALRLTQARAIQPSLSGEAAEAGLSFLSLLAQVEPVVPDQLVKEGDVLPFCGGCEILETPGHTRGHISLYIPAKQTLITGDAAVVADHTLHLANPQYAEDLASAETSLSRLIQVGAKHLVCYHGGVIHP